MKSKEYGTKDQKAGDSDGIACSLAEEVKTGDSSRKGTESLEERGGRRQKKNAQRIREQREEQKKNIW